MSHRSAVGIAFALAFLAMPSSALALPPSANPVARFDTAVGSFRVELFASEAPLSVANFLSYVASRRYQDVFIHRSVPGFVIQGGGYTFPSDAQGLTPVSPFPPIVNEFGISNTRGTLAMATLPGDPNSATSQWFFNLANNSALLDVQNYAVFGKVLDNGMDVVDAIAALPRVNAGGPFSTLPVVQLPTGQLLKQHLAIAGIQIVPEPSAAALAAIGLLLPARQRWIKCR
jgi:peptidyl-prolyl cis-trans isomerase A (cyclophilin A)